MTHRERLLRWTQISQALALTSDWQLARWVDEAQPLGSGIGGTTMRLDVEGQPVFAKRLRLSDLERRPENRLSTRNLFGLPTYCQRNVGSVGFGVWRELAAQVMTTGWVVSGQLACFPLTYHWRVLEGPAARGAMPLPDELADVEGMVRYWGGSDAMGARLRALNDATASVLVFLEHLPWTLSTWLDAQRDAGAEAAAAACTMVERCLSNDVPTMNRLGLLHGDAHLGNILTDGQQLFFADLGLATSRHFELSSAELTYLHEHASLDQAYALTQWINGLVKAWCTTPNGPLDRMELVRQVARGCAPERLIPDLPAAVAAAIQRHAPVATVVNDFYRQLHGERRDAVYPRAAIEAALLAAKAPTDNGA